MKDLFEEQKQIKDLCEQCYYREQSRRNCREFLKINPDGKGMVCDPAPKVECKDHELYGREVKNKIVCWDFRLLEPSDKVESLMETGIPKHIDRLTILG